MIQTRVYAACATVHRLYDAGRDSFSVLTLLVKFINIFFISFLLTHLLYYNLLQKYTVAYNCLRAFMRIKFQIDIYR